MENQDTTLADVKPAIENMPLNLRKELMFQVQWIEWDWPELMAKLSTYWRCVRKMDTWMPEMLENALASSVPENRGPVVWDIGCGALSVLNLIPDTFKRAGIDPLAHWYKTFYPLYESIEWVQGGWPNVVEHSLAGQKADLVISSNALDHMSDTKGSLDAIYQCLDERGRFVLTVDVFSEKRKRDDIHNDGMTQHELMTLLGESGFHIDRWEILDRKASLRCWVMDKPCPGDYHEVLVICRRKV